MRVPLATFVTPVVSTRAGLPRTMGLLVLSVALSSCTESPTSPSTTGGNAQPATTSSSTAANSSTSSTASKNGQTDVPQLGYSLRFAGSTSADVDRVKIPIDPNVSADVGRDFTVEFWLKSDPGANSSSTCQAGNDGWTYGNVVLDRDVSGDGDLGEYGVSVSGGRVAFGLARAGRAQTLCGLIDVADGRWHHVALTRRANDGQMRIYVDGTESAQGIGPLGDISYRDGRPTGSPQDPFLIVGAAKREANDAMQGFSGLIDELRVSSRVRYNAPFDRPAAAFTSDADTTLLLHFDEGPAGPCASSVMDTSGRATHGQCRYGGNGTPGPVYTVDVPFIPNPRQSRSWLLGEQPGTPAATTRPAPAATVPPQQ
jgi:hypothetical protein